MSLREQIRKRKRELGINEGMLEKLTPTPSQTTNFPSLQNLGDTGIARGTAEGPEKGQWYSVTFPRQIDNPVVVAVATEREGSIERKNIPRVSSPPGENIPNMPTLGFPGVNFDKVSIYRNIPRIERDDFNSHEYCDKIAENAVDKAKDLGPPSPLDSIWDWFCNNLVYTVAYYSWWGGGWVLNVLWDSFVQPQIDEVEKEIENTVDDINNEVNKLRQSIDNQVNDTVKEIEMGVDNRLNDITDATNNAISKNYSNMQDQIDQVQARVNNRLDDLYEMWGIPDNVAIAPVHVRNVDKNGFEWLSLGDMKIQWIAVGDAKEEDEGGVIPEPPEDGIIPEPPE